MEIQRHFMSQITWILMKIRCISYHKSTAVWSKSTPNSMTVPCHLSRFYLFFMLKHDMDFGQVQVMELPWHLLRKWWDFHRIWSHSRPDCRQKDMRKSLSHFLRGTYYFSYFFKCYFQTYSQLLLYNDKKHCNITNYQRPH